MSDQAAGVFVTVDIVIPRLSSSSPEWEVLLIRRNKQPYQGLWALPGGHLNTDDVSLEAAAQREVREETDLAIPLHMPCNRVASFMIGLEDALPLSVLSR